MLMHQYFVTSMGQERRAERQSLGQSNQEPPLRGGRSRGGAWGSGQYMDGLANASDRQAVVLCR